MNEKTFTGFSTNALRSAKREWVLHDKELIKRDLINHFYTRRGERVMRPDFGSRIFEYLMEPNTEQMQSQIFAEVERVVSLDPRLAVSNMQLFSNDHTVVVAMELFFRPFETSEIFKLEFDTRQGV